MIHFIRHAEAQSNVAANQFAKGTAERNRVYQKEEFFNSPLSEKGQQQAAALAERLREERTAPDAATGGPQGFRRVYVSTLERTLDTATISLAQFKSGGQPKWTATDLIRESAQGEYHPCDHRGELRGAGQAVEKYPHIDFAGCEDADPIPHNESQEALEARIRKFVEVLRGDVIVGGDGASVEAIEGDIAVVSHSAFLQKFFVWVLGREADSRFDNCEVKSAKLQDVLAFRG